MREEKIQGTGGQIHLRSWPTEGTARGVVVIVPGFNSHSGHYLWAGEQLALAHLAVYAVDLRGRGHSDGERFYVERFSDYVSDVDTAVQAAKARHPGLPVFLLGHSAGGVVACVYTLDHPGEVAGLICESFAHQVPAPDVALALLKGLSHVTPHLHVLRLKNEDFSRDQAFVDLMNTDPLIEDEVQPTQTVAEMVRADERLKDEFPQITLPILILHGTADKVTKPSGSQFFFDSAGSSDKTLKLYEGHAHDLLNDFGRDAVMADLKWWIEPRLPKT